MPFKTVVIQPGVKAIQTPTLLQANIVASNLIRWKGGLPEKYGGWMNFFSNVGVMGGGPSNVTVAGITRELCAWADLNLSNHLAVAGTNGLACLTPTQNGTPFTQNISPQYTTTTSGQTFTTTAGSPIVTIFDPGAQVNNYGSVQIQCHVAVGGIIIFGAFPITAMLTAEQYEITLPFNAISAATSVTAPCVATFTTTANSQVINVALTAHGLVQGGTFALPMPTTVGANNEVTLQGFYTVQQVIDANHFIIFAPHSVPTAATTNEANLSGAPQIIYWITQAPLLPNSGWGVGGWGVGGWGSGAQPVPLTGSQYPPAPGVPGFGAVTVDDWSLGNWGSQLISNAANGPLFAWDPISGIQNSARIANGPSYVTGFFVGMPEQQIIAYGASTAQVQDPMLVAWCDNANYNTWTAAVNNQAGTFRLTRGSKIIGGLQGPQQAMLWTDVGLWVMAYIGYPNVFGFNEVAQGCGLIGKHAIAVYGPQVFWMSRDAFWMYTNGAVQRLQCDVWDVVIKNLNNAKDTNGNFLYSNHIRGAANSGYDEIVFHFPSQASTNGENDSFVKFNPVSGEWDYSLSVPQQGMVGNTPINVTAWIDLNIFGHPISSMIAPDGANSIIMQHEMGMDANGQPINWMVLTGFFMLSDGEDKIFVDYMLPDFRWRRWQQHDPGIPIGGAQTTSAQVQITLYTADEPDNPLDQWVAYGPYIVTNATGGVEPRCRGRYFFARIQGNDLGSFVRLGGLKFRFAPDGRN
jgi:hypothetical protein